MRNSNRRRSMLRRSHQKVLNRRRNFMNFDVVLPSPTTTSR